MSGARAGRKPSKNQPTQTHLENVQQMEIGRQISVCNWLSFPRLFLAEEEHAKQNLQWVKGMVIN